LDQLQRNIESYLLDHGWFYERRSNFYRNLGKPGDRILSIHQLGTAVRALAFRTPRTAERRQKWLRDDNSYLQVFNPAWPLSLYLGCAVVLRSVEQATQNLSAIWYGAHISGIARQWGAFIALVITCTRLKEIEYQPQRLGELAGVILTLDGIETGLGAPPASSYRRREKSPLSYAMMMGQPVAEVKVLLAAANSTPVRLPDKLMFAA